MMEIFINFMHNKYLENTANAGFSQIDWVFLNIYITLLNVLHI